MKFTQNLKNELLQSPQLYQKMNILSMSYHELEEYINELSMENPLIEAPTFGIHSAPAHSSMYNQEGYSDIPIADEIPLTLKADLEEQMLLMKLDRETEQALKFLIINLDQRGYLPNTIVCKDTHELFSKALALLQSMEPAGVGARDLSECLMLQLARIGSEDSLAYRICDGYLEHLGKYHLNFLSQEFGVPESEVVKAKAVIESLNPIPANGYDSDTYSPCVIPDVEVILENNSPRLRMNMCTEQRVKISSFYLNMLSSDSITSQERAYFKEKLTQAEWAIDAIKQRQETMEKCCNILLQEQKTYFLTGDGLAPCSMSGMAERIGVHPSTISRTVKNKYLSCKWGTFPISAFFAHSVNGNSAEAVIAELKHIVQNEDPSKPFSDSKICSELLSRGFIVARRTVAKYREQANIPPATGRKKREKT